MKRQRLENWYVINSSRVQGEIYNAPRGFYQDGCSHRTSAVETYKNGGITTKSGSKYLLGKPHPMMFGIEPEQLPNTSTKIDDAVDALQKKVDEHLDSFIEKAFLILKQPEKAFWFFTFLDRHEHPRGYVMLYGTWGSAREEMFKRFGQKWGFQYTIDRFLPQIDKYGLYDIDAYSTYQIVYLTTQEK